MPAELRRLAESLAELEFVNLSHADSLQLSPHIAGHLSHGFVVSVFERSSHPLGGLHRLLPSLTSLKSQ